MSENNIAFVFPGQGSQKVGMLAEAHQQFQSVRDTFDEASQALGLSYRHMMSDVILPQAIRIVIPPLTNNCINVMKDTALASVVAMPDLLKQATQAQALEANPTPLIVAALMYLAILLPAVIFVGRLEKRYRGASQR